MLRSRFNSSTGTARYDSVSRNRPASTISFTRSRLPSQPTCASPEIPSMPACCRGLLVRSAESRTDDANPPLAVPLLPSTITRCAPNEPSCSSVAAKRGVPNTGFVSKLIEPANDAVPVPVVPTPRCTCTD